MKPVFIVGFPGVGKTTVGRWIAQKMELPFIDTDEFLINRYNSSIESMMECCGLEKFRKRETVAIIELSNKQDTIISTGGGLPTFGDNMDLMVQKGIVIYLTSEEETLAERLYTVRETRPAVAGLNLDQVREYVHTYLPKREIFYNEAHIKVDATHLSNVDEEKAVADECISKIQQYLENKQ